MPPRAGAQDVYINTMKAPRVKGRELCASHPLTPSVFNRGRHRLGHRRPLHDAGDHPGALGSPQGLLAKRITALPASPTRPCCRGDLRRAQTGRSDMGGGAGSASPPISLRAGLQHHFPTFRHMEIGDRRSETGTKTLQCGDRRSEIGDRIRASTGPGSEIRDRTRV